MVYLKKQTNKIKKTLSYIWQRKREQETGDGNGACCFPQGPGLVPSTHMWPHNCL